MTRRKFIRKMTGAAAVFILGVRRVGEKVSPRRFIRAVSSGKYPGTVRPLHKVTGPGKWSG